MARTFFQDFTRDNGLPITVEYSADGGEPDFDFPGHICDGGGSGPEVTILKAWPNTPFHKRKSGQIGIGPNGEKRTRDMDGRTRWEDQGFCGIAGSPMLIIGAAS